MLIYIVSYVRHCASVRLLSTVMSHRYSLADSDTYEPTVDECAVPTL